MKDRQLKILVQRLRTQSFLMVLYLIMERPGPRMLLGPQVLLEQVILAHPSWDGPRLT